MTYMRRMLVMQWVSFASKGSGGGGGSLSCSSRQIGSIHDAKFVFRLRRLGNSLSKKSWFELETNVILFWTLYMLQTTYLSEKHCLNLGLLRTSFIGM
jgi:hypothetical protein